VIWGGAGVLVAALAVGAGTVLRSSTTTTSTTTTVATTTTTTTVAHNFTLSAVGDTELGDTPRLPANPASYLAPIKASLAASIVIGNLEGTISNATASKCAPTSTECYAFRVPTTFAAIYRGAGFTVLNSANNHSHDFGTQGVADTTHAIEATGIVQAGLPGQIGVVRVGTTKVAFVDFAPYWNTNNLLNLPVAAQLIVRAKTLANVVVVYMHAGAEGTSADHVTRTTETYFGENRGNEYAFAHAAINAGADLVLASGPHVLRGMEWYRGHLIAYSLGDFANYYDFSAGGTLALSAVLHVTLSSTGSYVWGWLTPVRLSPSGQPFVDPTRASVAFINTLSKQDFGAAGVVIKPDGAIAPPTG
jgi:hypothetical protein